MYYCLLLMTHLVFESLPVSSSGHLYLLERLTYRLTGGCFALSQALNFLLHGPTSIILAVFFRKRWVPLVFNPVRCRYLILKLMMLGLCAEAPTLVFYFLFSRYEHLSSLFPLWVGFGITAGLLYSLRLCRVRQKTTIGPVDAFAIGCVQGIALLPGISRMGSTYVVGRWLGLSPRLSFCFSCTIEWPLITSAFMRGVWDSVHGMPLQVTGIVEILSISICLVFASMLSYRVLQWTESLMIRDRLWRLSFYMSIPFALSLVL